MRLNINNRDYEVDAPPAMPLLWVLRDLLHLRGTKFGCGRGLCGACTVHVDGSPIRSCVATAGSVKNQKITTIEGLSGAQLHPVQQAWIEVDVPQCGYCQAGQLMTAAWLIDNKPESTDQEIEEVMNGNLCRCSTYIRIRKAIHQAARIARDRKK